MSWYRRAGADLPFTDPARDHDIGMQGSFWRFVSDDRVVIVLHGRCRSPSGPWSLVAIAREPGHVNWAIGDELIASGPHWLRVRLPGDQLDATWTADRPWRVRHPLDALSAGHVFGGLGPAQSVPFLGQYWHPHLLRGAATVSVDGATRSALVYAERNWGSRFADDWWWGQAFVGDATVCFAGGRQFGAAPTSLVVALPDRIIRVAPPLRRIVTATAPGRWRIRARGIEVEAEAGPAGAHLLPVPIPAERRAVLRSRQHLTGRLRLTVDGVFEGETHLAGLERGTPYFEARAAGTASVPLT